MTEDIEQKIRAQIKAYQDNPDFKHILSDLNLLEIQLETYTRVRLEETITHLSTLIKVKMAETEALNEILRLRDLKIIELDQLINK